MTNLTNVGAVARREYTTRVRTRSFMFGTVMLVVAVLAIAFLPVIIGYFDRTDATRGAVHVCATDLSTDPVATMNAVLNAPTQAGATASGGQPDFIITAVPDLAAARQAVMDGTYGGVLDIARSPAGDLVFTLYTNGNAVGRDQPGRHRTAMGTNQAKSPAPTSKHQPPFRAAGRVPWPLGTQVTAAPLISIVRGATKLPQLYSPLAPVTV